MNKNTWHITLCQYSFLQKKSTKAEALAVCWSGTFRCVVNTVPRRKDISNDLKEVIVAAQKSEKGYKAISKQFEVHHFTGRKIIHMWKIFKTVANRQGTLPQGQTMWCSKEIAKRVAGESLFSLQRTWQHSLGLQNCSWTKHKTSGTMSVLDRRDQSGDV